MVSQLTVLATEERAMLDECMELLASTAALQVIREQPSVLEFKQ